jgi:hypothetical protein
LLFCVCYVDNPSSAKVHYAGEGCERRAAEHPSWWRLGADTAAAKTDGALTIAGNFSASVMTALMLRRSKKRQTTLGTKRSRGGP